MNRKTGRRTAFAAALWLTGTSAAFAHGLTGGTLEADCDGFVVTVNAASLEPNIDYTADYRVTISGCVASPETVTGQVALDRDPSTPSSGSGSASGSWPGSLTLDGTCQVTGSATLTQNPNSTKPLATASDPVTFACAPPQAQGICHNIGGPRKLGANCDMEGQCTIPLADGSTISVTGNRFLGIVINPSPRARAAHIQHGDGPILATFDPPLHLAKDLGPHKASNVECLGERVNPQPPEPGN